MRGFLSVDKPPGWSSHDAVAAVRRATQIKKVGHAGTLDPMATGLLVIAIGPVTRLISFVQDAEKEYVATAKLGIATDSLDADGEVVSRDPLPDPIAQVEAVLPQFRGAIEQVPPMVSALKQGGRRLYELAREGKEVEREARPVTIHELEVLGLTDGDYPELTFRAVCSKGTYVRTLGDDIARALGGRAHLTALRRTRIGTTTVEGALSPDGLTVASVTDALVDPVVALAMVPRVTVDTPTAGLVRTGRPLDPGSYGIAIADAVATGGDLEAVAIVDEGGRLLAVYRFTGNQLLPRIVLPA